MSQQALFPTPDRTPTHVVMDAGDPRSVCGLKAPFPRVAAEFVGAHVAGWGMVVCQDCSEAMP